MQFRKEPQLDHDRDALLWWKNNESRFPIIAKLAKQLFSVPATSVPSERILKLSMSLKYKKYEGFLLSEDVTGILFNT